MGLRNGKGKEGGGGGGSTGQGKVGPHPGFLSTKAITFFYKTWGPGLCSERPHLARLPGFWPRKGRDAFELA